ncbi:MAG: DUF4330 domain-containing protein [Thermacetogeniaceae bacterium]
MKLWEKGKLFGLLNIVDIIVILLVLAAVAGVAAKSTVFKKMLVKSTVSHVRTVVYVDDILPVSAAAPQVGDVVRELRSGDELGVVKEIQIQDHLEKASDAQGNWHMNPVPGKKALLLTLDGDLAAYNHQFRVGQADVKVGSKITITSDLYNFEGVIIKVEELK